MASFSDTSFSTGAFSVGAFDFGSAPPTAAIGATAGYFHRSVEEWRRRQDALREQPDQPALQPVDDGLAAYSEKAQKLTLGIEKVRSDRAAIEGETSALIARIAQLDERRRADDAEKARAQLLRKEQALVLAKAEEAALLEELAIIDVAYFSVVALAMVMQ